MTVDLDAIRELEVIAPDEHSVTRFVPFVQMPEAMRDALVGRIQEAEATAMRDAVIADGWVKRAEKAEAERDTLRAIQKRFREHLAYCPHSTPEDERAALAQGAGA